jgi:hypothetical protein
MLRTICILTLILVLSAVSHPGFSDVSDVIPHRDLIIKHRPILYMTAKDFSPPVPVDVMFNCSQLVDTQTGKIVMDEKGLPAVVNYELLKRYNNERYEIDMLAKYNRLFGKNNRENFLASPSPVIYATSRDLPEQGVVALFYFFFYPGSYTGKNFAKIAFRNHEGDNEMAVIFVDRKTGVPLRATTAMHYYGESRPWSQVLKGEDGRIKLFVAQNSHATWFTPNPKGHRVSRGNFGFKAHLHPSWKNTRDICTDERLINYSVITLPQNHILWHWQGRWGTHKKYSKMDKGYKNFNHGPRSFGRRQIPEGNEVFAGPDYFFAFYNTTSDLYSRLMFPLARVKDAKVRKMIFDLLADIGHARWQVNKKLDAEKFTALNKQLLLEVTPLLVLSNRRDAVNQIAQTCRELDQKKLLTLFHEISSEQLKLLTSSLENGKALKELEKLRRNPLSIYTMSPDQIKTILRDITGVELTVLNNLYQETDRRGPWIKRNSN